MGKPKVLVAMSGGVDSSMAAIMLMEKGYDLIGITLKVFANEKYRQIGLEKGIKDATTLCTQLEIPYYVIDIQKEFEKGIIDYFVDEYASGRTPNPCALCNYTIKWSKLIEIANEFDCQYIATGHYAKINNKYGRYYLSEAHDKLKDQTYFLWRLNQEYLKRTIFPLAEFEKKQIKKHASTKGLDNIANKSESYNICFIPAGGYREFLKSKLEPNAGQVLTEDGKEVGIHEGIWNYTIGQQEHMIKYVKESQFITSINPQTNQIILGSKDKLLKNSVLLKSLNFMKYESLADGTELYAKINYRSPLVKCTLHTKDSGLLLQFKKPVYPLAPGQSIVIYEGNDIVAGGVIE